MLPPVFGLKGEKTDGTCRRKETAKVQTGRVAYG